MFDNLNMYDDKSSPAPPMNSLPHDDNNTRVFLEVEQDGEEGDDVF